MLQADVKKTCYNGRVYEPSDDSFALVDALEQDKDSWCTGPACTFMEVGSGSGFVCCSVALMLQHALIRSHGLAVDISEHAVEATCGTLLAHDVATVDVMQGDLRSCLTAAMAGKFDLLVCNPPYVPTPEAEVSRGDIAAAWAGGDRGRNVLDSLLPLVSVLLAPMGHFFLVTVPENDPEEIMLILAKQGLKGRISLTRKADEELLHIMHAQFINSNNEITEL